MMAPFKIKEIYTFEKNNKLIGILPVLVFLFCINIIMKSEIIIPLIIGTWISIVAIILSVNKKTWRGIIISSLSPVISYEILKLYFIIRGLNFYLWLPQQYTFDNLNYFINNSIFIYCIIINIVSYLFFYFLLPKTPQIFYKKIYDFYYYKMMRIKKAREKFNNVGELAIKHKTFFNPVNPKNEIIYTKEKDIQFEYFLLMQCRSISLIIQFLFCVMIFVTFKLFILTIILLLILFLAIYPLIYKSIIDYRHK